MAVTPYKEKEYVQSEAVAKAQQALQSHQAGKPGGYQSQYQSGLDSLLGQIQNREKFHYDVNADALYNQVAQNYLRQGQQAMMDTVGKAAAMTGGYGNSYAETAGQQTYEQYLQGLTDLVPQYQQLAFSQYQAEGENLLDQYNLLLQQEESAYGRYQDDLSRYYAELDRLQGAYDSEREYDYNRFAEERDFSYGKYMDELNHQYRTDRDAVEDDQWLQELLYQQERDKVEDQQWQKEYEESIRQFNQNYNLKLQETQAALAAAAARSAAAARTTSPVSTYTPPSTGNQNFMTYMNEANRAAGRGGLTTQQAAALITQAAKDGVIKKEDQLNYMFIYG